MRWLRRERCLLGKPVELRSKDLRSVGPTGGKENRLLDVSL